MGATLSTEQTVVKEVTTEQTVNNKPQSNSQETLDIEKTEWDEGQFTIENGSLKIKLDANQAIVANIDSIVSMTNNIELHPLKITPNYVESVKKAAGEAPVAEGEVSGAPPSEGEAPEQKGGAPVKLNYGTISSKQDTQEVTISPPIIADIKQEMIKPGDSLYVIKSGLLAYTYGLNVDINSLTSDVSNIYEYTSDKGLVFIEITNKTDLTEYVWIYGFGNIEEYTDKKIPIEKIVAIKEKRYTIERKGENIWISVPDGNTVYTHSKSAMSLYINSKAALLGQVPEGKKDFPIAVPQPAQTVEPVKGGRRMFRNERRQIQKLNDPEETYKDLMKFIG